MKSDTRLDAGRIVLLASSMIFGFALMYAGRSIGGGAGYGGIGPVLAGCGIVFVSMGLLGFVFPRLSQIRYWDDLKKESLPSNILRVLCVATGAGLVDAALLFPVGGGEFNVLAILGISLMVIAGPAVNLTRIFSDYDNFDKYEGARNEIRICLLGIVAVGAVVVGLALCASPAARPPCL